MITRALAFSVAVLAAAPAGAQDIGWRTYETDAGIRVDLPLGVFTTDSGPNDDGTGRRFRSADQSATLTVQRFANDKGDTPAQFLARQNPPRGIVYKRVTPRFFVVSSYRDGNIWYNRCNFSGSAAGCLSVNYPASQKRQWDGIVTRVSRTLRVS